MTRLTLKKKAKHYIVAMLSLKVKIISDFPTCLELGVGTKKIYTGAGDRHGFDANPDPDLYRHQHGNSGPNPQHCHCCILNSVQYLSFIKLLLA
jgi:hypothetical protein